MLWITLQRLARMGYLYQIVTLLSLIAPSMQDFLKQVQGKLLNCYPRLITKPTLSNPPLKNLENIHQNIEIHEIDEPEAFDSIVVGKEPSYEGGKCLLESVSTVLVNKEPVSEGEVVLIEQVDKGSAIDCNPSSEDRTTTKQGKLTRNFLKNIASQLTRVFMVD
ncbi:unnamed protein product [Fraxinus pennsylvanica]|uniref:Uncharacterized protein n=1 Tax=Fraxinus pennsylvanica TaxID=56036 RepID=A0AAD2E2N2_9LAMI|nr:unnamed protein product [Fraxinus pennsylvanica]